VRIVTAKSKTCCVQLNLLKKYSNQSSAIKKEAGKLPFQTGAGEESRTLDLNLGKVALYQLSYSRINNRCAL
jgi:hypothetical protein